MGFENNAALSAAAAAARAVHDRAAGPTSGSPIGAAAAEIAEAAAQQKLNDALTPADNVPEFFAVILDSIFNGAAPDAADQKDAEMIDDAAEDYAVAQGLTGMSNNAEALADQLELIGKGDVAEFVREAAKLVRKGAKLARSNARDTLSDVDC